MGIRTESFKHGQIIEICIAGNALSEADCMPLIDTVEDNLNSGVKKFIINLEQVQTLNSIGLNMLIRAFTLVRNAGGELYIVNISSKINQVLLLTKLNTVLNIATSFKNALEQLNK